MGAWLQQAVQLLDPARKPDRQLLVRMSLILEDQTMGIESFKFDDFTGKETYIVSDL